MPPPASGPCHTPVVTSGSGGFGRLDLQNEGSGRATKITTEEGNKNISNTLIFEFDLSFLGAENILQISANSCVVTLDLCKINKIDVAWSRG